MDSEIAVYVQGASKSYGKKQVLTGLNMQVQKGTIYGLLGASGCGKTTLLRCIVGTAKLDSGDIWVLGGRPGTPESGVPGSAVGYMPQEIALINELTVQGAIYYFARIYGIPRSAMEKKYDELSKLLVLPPSDRYVRDCSGGQKRRISLAAALVGKSKLLILDEPTVGLDPVVRETIWKYLVELVNKNNTAIIITTHYIEETRQAHKIGLLRKGVLLTEGAPEVLLTRYETNSLEEVFLMLSQRQSDGQLTEDRTANTRNAIENQNLSSVTSSTNTLNTEINSSQDLLKPPRKKKCKGSSTSFGLNYYRSTALLCKNWNQVVKNRSGLIFMLFFPCLQAFLFFLTMGNDVTDVKVAIINHEDDFGTCSNYSRNETAIPNEDYECSFKQLGCRYIEYLQDPMIRLIHYNDSRKAREAITHGEVVGAVYIPQNFSTSLEERMANGMETSSETLNSSQVQVWLDVSERQVGSSIKYKLIEKMIGLQKIVFTECKYLPKVGDVPLQFEEAIYGHNRETFRVFMIPGVLLSIMFFLGSINTTPTIIEDRLGGMWERSLIAGVSSLEIILTHFVIQLLLVTVQAIILITVAFAIYQTEFIGNFGTIFLLTILQGVCGMTYGFFISVTSVNFSMANIAASGVFYPMMLLCGLIWPLEGMPSVLYHFSKCLPFTIPIISLRNVIKKGWSLFHLEVINGVAIEITWILILLTLTILSLRNKK